MIIIESSEIIRERIATLMGQVEGLEVVGLAATAGFGLDLCVERQPRAVIAGLETPDMNGLKLLQRLRETLPNGRIVALTNCSFKGLQQLSIECGADHCFNKMTEFEKAVEVCKELFESMSVCTDSDPCSK